MDIFFNKEDVDFCVEHPALLRRWISECIVFEGKKLVEMSYVFCSDKYLLKLNKRYLQHDCFTDVLTFDYADGEGLIDGEAYISVDRVKEHADIFGVSFYEELCRVMIHAVLHLVGYDDKTPEEKVRMGTAENKWLEESLLQEFLARVYG